MVNRLLKEQKNIIKAIKKDYLSYKKALDKIYKHSNDMDIILGQAQILNNICYNFLYDYSNKLSDLEYYLTGNKVYVYPKSLMDYAESKKSYIIFNDLITKKEYKKEF